MTLTLRVWLHENGQYVATCDEHGWRDVVDGEWRPAGYGTTPAEAVHDLFSLGLLSKEIE